MARVVPLCETRLSKGLTDTGHEAGLRQGGVVAKMKEWSHPVATSGHICQNIAATGHKSLAVVPTKTATPWPNWSHFETFRKIRTAEGGKPPSTATSPHAKCLAGSKAVAEGTVSSPALKNPKKHVVAAAQTIRLSPSKGDSTARIRRRMWGVIGRRGLEGPGPERARSRLTPPCMRRSRGSEDDCLGSGRPRTTWACLTAARYVLMVAGARPCLASSAT